ncbi:hypothetical protein MRX96_053622 [Rhipicephalus microplus]
MARSLASLPAKMFVLPLVLLVATRVQAQDTSAILSGECVHAITALLCDQVVDEIQCGASYLRCCVPKEFSLGGTAVETSAPLAEDEMVPATSPATAVDEDSNATVPTPLPPPERGQRPGSGFFAQQQGAPMRQQGPTVQQQRPFGAIIPQQRPYQNHPQAHDQLNAVIPVDQAMIDQIALDGGDIVHRRPQPRARRASAARPTGWYTQRAFSAAPRRDHHKVDFGRSNKDLVLRSD